MSEYDTITTAIAEQRLATSLLLPLFSGLCHIFLFGLVCSAFSSYLRSDYYCNDSKTNKRLVWAVVLLDAIATAFNVSQALHYAVSQARATDYLFLNILQPTDSGPDFCLPTLALLVQVFLARRASKLFSGSKRGLIAFKSIVGFLICFSWLAGTWSAIIGVLFLYDKQDAVLPFTYNIALGVYLFCSATVDTVITCTLLFALRRKIQNFNNQTDGVVRKLMHIAAETASYTTFMAVSGALAAVIFPMASIYTVNITFAFYYPLPSLYTLSLLTTLSARKTIANRLTFGSFTSGQQASAPGGSGGASNSLRRPSNANYMDSILVMQQRSSTVEVGLTLVKLDEEDELESGETDSDGKSSRPIVNWAV